MTKNKSRTKSRKKSRSNKRKKTNKKIGLDKCLKYLNNPMMVLTTPPTCYNLLDFPNEKSSFKINLGANYQHFKSLFPKKLAITDKIQVLKNDQLFVPHKLKNELKRGPPMGYTLTPIHFKDTNNYYVLVGDNFLHDWEIFIPPGNYQVHDSIKITKKIKDLLVDKLNIRIDYYYHPINYGPKPNTIHYDWWQSWLIYQKIKNNGKFQRESLVNKSLEKILRNDKEYKIFVKKYKTSLLK